MNLPALLSEYRSLRAFAALSFYLLARRRLRFQQFFQNRIEFLFFHFHKSIPLGCLRTIPLNVVGRNKANIPYPLVVEAMVALDNKGSDL